MSADVRLVAGRRFMFGGEHGQMAVELAIVLPVIVAVMVVVVDCMVYLGQCARLDHLAPQQTLAIAASPARELYSPEDRVVAVEEALQAEFPSDEVIISVSSENAGVALSSMEVYTYSLRMSPWPLSRGGTVLFGMRVPVYLEHEYSFAFDPYTPGEL